MGGGGGGGASGTTGGAGGAGQGAGGAGGASATTSGNTSTGGDGGSGLSGGGGGGGGGSHAYSGSLSGATLTTYVGGNGADGATATSAAGGGGGGGGGFGMVITGLNGTSGTLAATTITAGVGGVGNAGVSSSGGGGGGGTGLFIASGTGTNSVTVNAAISGGAGGYSNARGGAGGAGLDVQRSTVGLTVNVGGAVTGGAGGGGGAGVGGSGASGISVEGTNPSVTLNITADVTGGNGGLGTTGSGGGGNAISANTATIVIDGTAGPVTITGGSAGSLTSGGVGAGIYGTDLSVTLRGDVTVTGGQGQGGGWDMVLLGTSTLTLEADASGNSPTVVNVNPVNTGTLVLTGSNNGSAAADLTSRFDTVTKTGSSTWTLTSGSRVSVVTAWNLNEGTLAVSSDNIFTSGATVTFGGGTLSATETMTVASAVSLAGAGTFQVAANETLTVSGALSGSQGFSKTGMGTLTLTDANSSYTGAVTVSAGTLALSGAGGLPNAAGVTLGANTTLDISATTSGAIVSDLSSSSGSARVVLGSQTLTVNPTTQITFSGIISGSGGLTVSGLGDLFLTGDNTYTGTTTVASFSALSLGHSSASGSVAGNIVVNAGGELTFGRTDTYTINNSITTAAGTAVYFTSGGTYSYAGSGVISGAVAVDGATLRLIANEFANASILAIRGGGTLSGAGTVGNLSVYTGGIVAPGNSPGTIAVNGTVTFNSGSTYRVDVTPGGAHDLISATGAVTINGGTVEVVAVPGQYAPNSSYAIITTTSTFTGTFDSVTSDYAFLTPSLSYDAQNVYLMLVYAGSSATQFSAFAQTPNQTAVANAAQTLGEGNAVFDALLQQTTSSAPGAFNALSGEAYASTGTLIQQQAVYVREAVGSRLMQSLTAPGVSPLAYGAGPQTAALGEGLTPTLWAQGYGGWGNSFSNGNAASISNNIGGFLLGMDVALAPNVRAGLFGGFSESQFDVTDRSSSGSMNNVDIGLYAGAQFGALAVRGGAAYTWHDVSTSRTVAFPGFSQAVEGSYNTGTTQVFGELGYDMAVGAFAFEPFAGLAYVHVAGASLLEGGGSVALSVSTSGMDTVYSTLGLRMATTMQLWGATLTPRATIGWQHAFGDTTPTSTMQFQGGTTPFSVSGVPIAEDALLLEAGLSYALSSKATLGASYTSQLAATAAQNAFTAQFSLKF